MQHKFLYLFLFCLTFSKYSCFFNVNTGKYEEILNEVGRQFFTGLCLSLDGTELLGIQCTEKHDELYSYNQVLSPVPQAEDTFNPIIKVAPLGTAVGKVMKTYLDKPFYSFIGIKFGTAGTFEMPKLYEKPWSEDFMGGYDATYIRNKCPQSSLAMPVIGGDEDCLYLNVFTPQFDKEGPNRKFPVMVFIYGGGFTMGDTSLYVPSRLIEEDVIVVVLQYRVGTLGFLYSGTTSAPGNMGLMDQVTALRWVKKYIKYFNGDDENITVFGESAGAASASWMQFTPQTSADFNDGTQLLDKVILQSGSVLEMWTLDPNYENSIILHGEATGCYVEGDTPDDIVTCMKDLPTEDIVRGSLRVKRDKLRLGNLGFDGVTPVIQDTLLESFEGDESLIHEYIVIPKSPLDMIKNDDFLPLDVLAGSVRDEGSLIVGAIYAGYLVPNGLQRDQNFIKYESIPLLVDAFGIPDDTGAVSNSFRLAFLPNADLSNSSQMTGGMVDLGGMLFLKSGLWRLTQLLTLNNPDNNIFFYSFEYESNDSLFDWLFFNQPDIPIDGGICHADDLLYFFALPGNPDYNDKATIKKMNRLWKNFAYYSDPTPDNDRASWMDLTSKWLPYSFEQENILLMENEFVQSEDFVKRWNYNQLK